MSESVQNAFSQLHPVGLGLLFLFILLYLLKMFYLFLFSARVAFYKNLQECGNSPFSFLLPFRNEEENLRKILPMLLEQIENDCELVVVDDFSLDNSMIVLGSFKDRFKNLKISSLNQETRYSEKLSRNIALKAASNDWVTVLPASLELNGYNRLKGFSSGPETPWKDVVVNYTSILPGSGLFNLLYRVEFFLQQIKSFGFILNGLPYVVSEENVAIKKVKYFQSECFRGMINEPFAHLELVINSFIRKPSTLLNINKESVIRKKENISKLQFLELLKKEIRLTGFLSYRKKFWLAFFEWVNFLLFPVTVLVLVLYPALWAAIIVLIIILFFCHSLIIKKILNRLDESKLLLPSLLFAWLLQYFKLIYSAVYKLHYRKKGWKVKR